MMSVVFFGTPEFAVPSLEALLGAADIEVPFVVTQPDRAVGRHAEVRPSAVGAKAAERGLAVEKPASIRVNPGLLERLQRAKPDAIAVVAYGKILPKEILDLPRLGCVNVHASLLPRHRGASPIQAAILSGDRETGVMTMKIEPELDAGPIYLERRVPIGETATAGELSDRLAMLGGELLVETLSALPSGGLTARPQQGEPTFTRPIRREDAEIDWERSAGELSRRLRAFTPWPGLHTHLGGERVKLLEVEPSLQGVSLAPGTFDIDGDALVAATGGGTALRIRRLQRAGRKPVTGAEFARAVRLPGRFGPSR